MVRGATTYLFDINIYLLQPQPQAMFQSARIFCDTLQSLVLWYGLILLLELYPVKPFSLFFYVFTILYIHYFHSFDVIYFDNTHTVIYYVFSIY